MAPVTAVGEHGPRDAGRDNLRLHCRLRPAEGRRAGLSVDAGQQRLRWRPRAAPCGRQGRRDAAAALRRHLRSEEHTSELQSLMRTSYAVFCLQKKKTEETTHQTI